MADIPTPCFKFALPALSRFLALPAIAAIAHVQPALAETATPGVSGGTAVQALLGLLAIVALLLGTLWLARKVTGGKGFGQGGMKVIGGVSLGPRERIVMIETGDTWLVIGIVPGQIRTLHTMPRGELAPSEGESSEKPFAHWLKQISERRG